MNVLDHFAGTGWGVACAWLGLKEYGVEIMPEAIATREAAGFETVYNDVWEGLLDPSLVPEHDIYLASPPCQTFSVAGKGAGRKALDQVLEVIRMEAWRYPEVLKSLGGDLGDDRTALVLTPLAHIWAHRPRYVALEQVPTVLPVWEEIARVMREQMGYSVWTGNLQAEMYGVPQTRKRAILIARADGKEAKAPTATHSRYYSRDPQRLDDGVKKWVSMAEALGWGLGDRPSPTITGGGTATGGAEPIAKFARYGLERRLESSEAATLQSYPQWCFDRPATTVVGTFCPDVISAPGYRTVGGHSRQNEPNSVKLDQDGIATLQSFPTPFPFQGSKSKQFLQIGNAVPPLLAKAILEELIA